MSTNRLAKRASRLTPSPIREILSVASRPGMISFAGGLPDADTFPEVESLSFEKSDLQYGPSEGEPYLREHVANEIQGRGWQINADQVLILSGSQQGIDLVAKLIVDEGTKVAVESPTYLAALQVFKLFGADYVPYDIETVASAVSKESPTLLYAIPTFQNPSSSVYTTAQRQQLAQSCERGNTILFEDDPYRDLSYQECDKQAVCSFMEKGSWIYQSTFSKTVAPGLRLGYLVCSADLYPQLLMLKQAADLHSSRVSQRIVQNILSDEQAGLRLARLQTLYKAKRDSFDACLTTYFDDLATWELPAGGLFFWLQLKTTTPINTRLLLSAAVESGVTFMPGEAFYADGREAANCFRLNFSSTKEEDFEKGLSTLASIFKSGIAMQNPTVA